MMVTLAFNKLKLQIDHVILDGQNQTCLGTPKEAFETYIFQKLLDFKNQFLDPCL